MSSGDATASERHAMHSLRIASPHLACGAAKHPREAHVAGRLWRGEDCCS